VPQLLDVLCNLDERTQYQLVHLTWVSPFLVFTETLRKYPIVPFLDRKCFSDYELPSPSGNGTITLPAGTGVFVSVLGIQHDPQYFPQPEIFDPQRFTEENKRSRPKYTYIPFGEGLRMCIGNITLSILNYEIVDFKDIRVKFRTLRFLRPCSSVGTK
jgi:cytochrome P450 family 6